MLKEFKEFALKGNVIDLAVGVIIGGAFGKLITSLVNDVIMPLIGLVLGKIDFANLFITLGEGTFKTVAEAKEAGVSTLNYGLFLNTTIDFIIIAFCIFFVIRQVNRFKPKAPVVVAEPTTKPCPFCFTDIHKAASRCPHCTSELK